MISILKFDQCRSREVKRNIEIKIIVIKGKYIYGISGSIHETKSSRKKVVILWKIRNTIIYKNTLEKELLSAGKSLFLNRLLILVHRIMQKIQRYLLYSPPHCHKHSLFHYQHPLPHIHYYNLIFTVYIRGHSQCCTFYQFEQMYNDIQHYCFIQRRFTAPQILCGLFVSF